MKKPNSDVKVTGEQVNEKEVWKLAQNPHLIAYILGDLERAVKKDIPSKLSSFFTCLSAYTRDPIVNDLKGPSGVGKTINAKKSSEYFPEEDVLLLGGLSPKSLIHEHGVLMDGNDQPILPEDKPVQPKRRWYRSGDEGTDEYDQALANYRSELNVWTERNRNSYKLIQLHNKIIIFLESPPEETIRMLLPILSHDAKRIEYKYVVEMQTKTAIIEGWPAAILLDTGGKHIEELSTRAITVTPESGKDKIEEANKLTNVQASYPWKYREEAESTRIIREIILRVKEKFVNENLDIVIPFDNLHEMFPREIVRDMRDFKHFVQLLKTLTSLHTFQRPILQKHERRYLLASIDDVVMALCIYSRIFETTRTGTEENVLKFYHEIVKTANAWLKRDLVTEYNKRHKKKMSGDTIGWWLRRLSVIGYVTIRKHADDKRVNVYEPLVKDEEKHEIVRILENREVLRSKLEEGFGSWLKNEVEEKKFFQHKILDESTILREISLDLVRDNIKKNSFRNVPSIFNSIYTELFALKPEKQPEKTRKTDNRISSGDSELEERCAICNQKMEDEIASVGLYIVHPECRQELLDRGYGEEDIIENIKQWKKSRRKLKLTVRKKLDKNMEEIFHKGSNPNNCVKCGQPVKETGKMLDDNSNVPYDVCRGEKFEPPFEYAIKLGELAVHKPRCAVCNRELAGDCRVVGAYRDEYSLMNLGGYITCPSCYEALRKEGYNESEIIIGIARLIKEKAKHFGMAMCKSCQSSLYHSGNAREGIAIERFCTYRGVEYDAKVHVLCYYTLPRERADVEEAEFIAGLYDKDTINKAMNECDQYLFEKSNALKNCHYK